MNASAIHYRHDRRPGDDQLIVDLHRLGYAQEGDRFGPLFCAYVGETVAEAQLERADSGRVWFAECAGETLGCAAMINRGHRGQLRWVVLLPEARGLGVGKKLVDLALDHARLLGFTEVFLETTDNLPASMALYERLGFQTVHDEPADLWHGAGQLIVMTLPLGESR